MKHQFGMRLLLALVTICALTCAAYAWLLSKSGYALFGAVPPLFLPAISVMGIGILLVPLFCLPLLLGMVTTALLVMPRPLTLIFFVTIQFAVFVVDLSYWGNANRFIAVMLSSSIMLIAEVYIRRLPRAQKSVAAISLVVTAAWYVAAVCLCASASV